MINEVENFLKNEYEKTSEENLFAVVKILPRNNFLDKLIIHYLCNLEFEKISNSYLNKFVNIQSRIDKSPEKYYFVQIGVDCIEIYYNNLIKLNPDLSIDDLVYKLLSNWNDCIFIHLFHLLSNKKFCRATLKHIFHSILYFPD